MNLSIKLILLLGTAIFLSLFVEIFNRAYKHSANDVIDAWLFSETNALQEGQLLPTLSKAERLIKDSDILSGMQVFDLANERQPPLMTVGVNFAVPRTFTRKVSQLGQFDLWIWPMNYLVGRRIVGWPNKIIVFQTRMGFWLILLGIVLGWAIFLSSFLVVVVRKFNADRFILFKNSLESLASNQSEIGFLKNESPAFANVWMETQNQIKISSEELARTRSQVEVVAVAKQVAHDIRSPLSAIAMIAKKLPSEVPVSQRSLLESAIVRIEGIAEDLLKKSQSKKSNRELDNKVKLNEVDEVIQLVREIASEKRVTGHSKHIECLVHGEPSGQLRTNLILLGRIISNVIQNSIEALTNRSGTINCHISVEGSYLNISISDNGTGIPPSILSKLGSEPISHGKNLNKDGSGSGLGVFHARKSIEDMGGKFHIVSKLGEGTLVSILLPLDSKKSN